MTDATAKVRGFRVGLMRNSSAGVRYKPAAWVGLASDGGVMVSPYPSSGTWAYGVVRNSGPTDGAHVHTTKTPKLHYHRSGIASITLTGERIDTRRLQLHPLHTLRQAQILSIG